MAEQTSFPTPGPLGLQGDQYWSKPLEQPGPMAFGERLVDKDLDGLFLDAPPHVPLDKRRSIPLVVMRGGETVRLYRNPLRAIGQYIAVHLETGRIQMAKAAETPPRETESEEPSPGWSMESLESEFSEVLDLGPRLGRYRVRILCGNQSSPARDLELFPTADPAAPQEIQKGLTRLREEGGPPHAPLQGKTLGLAHAGAPAGDPKDPLFKIAVSPDAAGRPILHLAYRLLGLPRFVFPTDKPRLDADGKRIHASLPVLLAGFTEEGHAAFQLATGLPVMAAPGGDPKRPLLAGQLSLDLKALAGPAWKGKGLSVWAFAMDQAAQAAYRP